MALSRSTFKTVSIGAAKHSENSVYRVLRAYCERSAARRKRVAAREKSPAHKREADYHSESTNRVCRPHMSLVISSSGSPIISRPDRSRPAVIIYVFDYSPIGRAKKERKEQRPDIFVRDRIVGQSFFATFDRESRGRTTDRR